MDLFDSITANAAWAARCAAHVGSSLPSIPLPNLTTITDPTVLSVITNTAFIGLAPFLFILHNDSANVVRPGRLMWHKTTASVLITITDVALSFSTTCHESQIVNSRSIATAAVVCFSTGSLMYAVSVDHLRTLCSSALLTSCIILAIVCDTTQVWVSYWQNETSSISIAASLITVCLKTSLLYLCELPKQPLILDDDLQKATKSRDTTGLINRTVLANLSEPEGAIKVTDLKDLDPQFRSSKLLDDFNHHWGTANKDSPHALAKVCGYMMRWQLLAVAPMRFLCSLFLVMQPLIVRSAMLYAIETYQFDFNKYLGIGLIVGAFFVYGNIAICRAMYTWANARLATSIRGTIIAAIYQKTLSLLPREAEQQAAITLMSTDLEGLLSGISIFHNVWANLFEYVTCLSLLASTLGYTAFLVILPACISHFGGWYISEGMAGSRTEWNLRTQSRVAKVSAMLSQVKAIKMIGLNHVIIRQLQSLEKLELAALKQHRLWSIALVVMLEFCTMMTSPLIIGAVLFWSTSAGKLSATDLFVSLTIIAIMSEEENQVAALWSHLMSTLACVQRVQDYLLVSETHDQRTRDFISIKRNDATANNEHEHEVTEGPMQDLTDEPRNPNDVFELQNADITIDNMQDSLLRDINLKVSTGEVVMIVGHTGTGKSTFLRTVTGEARLISGLRYKKRCGTAYCGQRVWLQNRSVRQNIIAHNQLDAEWYSDVLDACLLKPDLRRLPKADRTIIGSNGVKLSGGQQQRVALARAIYSKAPILALDNIFGCLDDSTAREIGLRLVGPGGLLKRMRSTVFMVTYSTQLLRYANRICLIDTDGSLRERQGGDDEHFINQLGNILVDYATEQSREKRRAEGQKASDQALLESINNTDEIIATNRKADARRSGDWTLVLYYLQTFDAGKFALWLLSTLVMSFTEMLPIAYACLWLESEPGDGLSFKEYAIFSAVSSFVTGGNLLMWFMSLVPNSLAHIHRCLLETTLDVTWHHLCSVDLASILNLFSQDMSSISVTLNVEFVKAIYFFANLLIQSCIIIYFTGEYASIAITASLVAFYLVQFFYLRVSRQARYLELESKMNVSAHFTETSNGLEHIRAFNWEDQNMRHALRLLDIAQKPFYYKQSIERWLRLLLDGIIMGLGVFLVTQSVILATSLPGSRVGGSLTALIPLSYNLTGFVSVRASLQASIGALDRIRSFSKATPREHGLTEEKDVVLPKEWPANGKVVMQNVTASYESTLPPSLQNVSIMLPPGRKVGVIGSTGSGKSSFVMTILKFLKYSGSITIDGVDISKVPHNVLRSRITTVSQDSIEFDESIRFNLCPWTMSLSKEENNVHEIGVIEILKEFGIWDRCVKNGGLEARISELNLSDGQKQLLYIARACLHKLHTRSRLVILDETTSGFDRRTEMVALKVMNIAFWDCTVIEVAHRKTRLVDAEIILHMEDGKIARQELPTAGTSATTTTTTTATIPATSAGPSIPPAQPIAPVPMSPRFQGMLNSSLAAEREARRQIEANPELYGPLPPSWGKG